MRIYVPAVPSMLAALVADAELPAPRAVFAVTTELSQWVDEASDGDADDEEHEYAAMGEASRHSLRLLATAGEPPCRVVLAADVPDSDVAAVPDGWPGEVEFRAPLTTAQLVSVHVDDADATDAVSAASAAVLRADTGHEASEQLVSAADEDELLWYAGAELALLVAERGYVR